MSYNDRKDKCVKPVLNTFVGYELSLENFQPSIDDAKDIKAESINVSTAVQNLKYHDRLNWPVMWLRRFMKAYTVDEVKD